MAAHDIDVSSLPTFAFGPRSIVWWGNAGLIAIEASVFALTFASYFYFRQDFVEWPPSDAGPPGLGFATANTLLLLASMLPMGWVSRHAHEARQKSLRNLLVLSALMMAGSIALRIGEFHDLHTYWDEHAYGSVLWMLLGLHTTHLVASVLETAVLAHFCTIKELDPNHRVDLTVNSVYWYFVVIAWLSIYGIVFWLPRLM